MSPKKTVEAQLWSDAKKLHGDNRVVLGPYFSFQLLNTPRRILFAFSRHKFAAKLIGPGKRVLEVGCSEGLCTVYLAEFASYCLGVDIDADAIAHARQTLSRPNLEFKEADILKGKVGDFDAVTNFDVIEHIYPENEKAFFEGMVANLAADGMCVIGTPNITSDQYASPQTRAGHINLYSAERLQASMNEYFKKVMIFSSNDEMIHTGFTPMAQYLIGVGIGRLK
jgi:2-polyprenyl-3-methyl-5-hydroxy-6-metoxy-1,4-benzoquinol methylase